MGQHCVKSACIRSYSDTYFSTFGLKMERYGVSLGVSLRIHAECGKIRTIITPNTAPFHTVQIKKASKIGQEQKKLWDLALRNFCLLWPNFSFWKGDWALVPVSTQFGIFLIFGNFLRFFLLCGHFTRPASKMPWA